MVTIPNHYTLSIVASMLITIAVGMLLGITYIFKESKKEGKWKFSIKLSLLALPLFCMSIAIPLDIFLWNFYNHPFIKGEGPVMLLFYISPFVQIAFGYVLLRCFYKNKDLSK